MRYFFKLAEGIQTLPIMVALTRQPHLWNADNCRRELDGSPHTQVDDILLRFGDNKDVANNKLEATNSPTMAKLPVFEQVLNIMRLVGGSRLGRVIITKLEPGKKILAHADSRGEYSEYYTRYHLVLQGYPGSMFNCGDETVHMLTGELWWFDARAEHSVTNNSKDDRVHLLIDVRIDT